MTEDLTTELNAAKNSDPVPTTSDKKDSPLSLGDLQNCLLIIDAAVDRKAFGGWKELNQIQEIRNRLEIFIKKITPAASVPLPEPLTEDKIRKRNY